MVKYIHKKGFYLKKKNIVSREVRSDVNSESIWVEFINRREKLIIANIYRPPNLSREASTLFFQEINAAAKYRNACIMGILITEV